MSCRFLLVGPIVVFLLFVIYPVLYGLWLGSSPASYLALFRDPLYLRTVWNTLLLLIIGVNLKMFLALLLSGYFHQNYRWVKWLFLIYILPWAVPAIPTFISAHWMLNGQWGLVNNVIWDLFQTDGPPWLDRTNLAMGAVIYAYIWKWLPFWTVIFLAGRMAIPKELYEVAEVDGASGLKQFANITFPIMVGLCGKGIAVTEEEALRAMVLAFNRLKIVVEPGGAVALAAALFHGDELESETVIAVASGGNVDPEVMTGALSRLG